MNWIKKLLGIRPIDKKRKEVASLREKAMTAQRSGDLRTYGELCKKIEDLEDEIIGIMKESD
tara:strand:- start:166 stop:351 length:186 start_codon:yes stop_codon:yes gene_type:complete